MVESKNFCFQPFFRIANKAVLFDCMILCLYSIFYSIIEDLLNLYLQKNFIVSVIFIANKISPGTSISTLNSGASVSFYIIVSISVPFLNRNTILPSRYTVA